MVRKETCPNCKGNRYIEIKSTDGRRAQTPCPHCNGNGYKIRLTH